MKPKKLIWWSALCTLIGSCFLYSFYVNADWYVKHVHYDLVMGLLIAIVLLMSLGGAVFFAYGLQRFFEE